MCRPLPATTSSCRHSRRRSRRDRPCPACSWPRANTSRRHTSIVAKTASNRRAPFGAGARSPPRVHPPHIGHPFRRAAHESHLRPYGHAYGVGEDRSTLREHCVANRIDVASVHVDDQEETFDKDGKIRVARVWLVHEAKVIAGSGPLRREGML